MKSACPLCHSSDVQSINDPDFVKCAACDAVYIDREDNAIERQRILLSYHAAAHNGPPNPITDPLHFAFELKLLKEHCGSQSSSGRVLDIGAAFGEFVSALNQSGMSASGIEPDPNRVAIGRARGLDLRNGRFDQETIVREFPNERFDIISLRECICYFDDFEVAFRLLHRLLAPGGSLYVKSHVSDSPIYWFRYPLIKRIGPFCTVFFNRKALLATLDKGGFEVLTTARQSLSPIHAWEGWGFSPWISGRILYHLFSFLLRLAPPDRFFVIAKARKLADAPPERATLSNSPN